MWTERDLSAGILYEARRLVSRTNRRASDELDLFLGRARQPTTIARPRRINPFESAAAPGNQKLENRKIENGTPGSWTPKIEKPGT